LTGRVYIRRKSRGKDLSLGKAKGAMCGRGTLLITVERRGLIEAEAIRKHPAW